MGNSPAFTGMLVQALIDNEEVASVVVDTAGSFDYLMLIVQPAGSSFTGKTVYFTINGLPATEILTWESGGRNILHLTAPSVQPTDTPVPTAAPANTLPPVIVMGEKGEKGDQGDSGLAGPQGDRGPQGDQGLPGAAGAAGPAGQSGPAGQHGLDGRDGPRGPAGEMGQPGPAGSDAPLIAAYIALVMAVITMALVIIRWIWEWLSQA